MTSLIEYLSVIPWYGWIGIATILAASILVLARVNFNAKTGDRWRSRNS
ncbi:MAG: hypothetical protein AB7N71_00605 [Phycisphaerae bacterium]